MAAADTVATVALYDGRCVRTYVRGHNLPQFAGDVQAYRLLVTYHGKSFDLPVLRRCLGCRLDQAHIDLRHSLAGLGLRGGLKACERQVGLARPGLEEVDGPVAVLLWHAYRRRHDPRALETLLAYNVQDAVSLEALMVHAHNAGLARLAAAPFAAGYRLPPPAAPANPFTPDADTVRRVLREGRRFFPTGPADRSAFAERESRHPGARPRGRGGGRAGRGGGGGAGGHGTGSLGLRPPDDREPAADLPGLGPKDDALLTAGDGGDVFTGRG